MDSVKLPEEKYLVFGGEAPVTNEATYICRFYQDGHVFIGKYLGSENKCLAAYRKYIKVMLLILYEILTNVQYICGRS